MGTYITACDFLLTAENYSEVEKIAGIYDWCSPEEIYTRNADGTFNIGELKEPENFFEGDVSYSYDEDLKELVSHCMAGSYVVVLNRDEGAAWYKVWKDSNGNVQSNWRVISNPFPDFRLAKGLKTNDCVLTLDEDDIISCIDVDDYAKLSEAELRKVVACANRNYKAAILNTPELLIDSVNDAVHECTNL